MAKLALAASVVVALAILGLGIPWGQILKPSGIKIPAAATPSRPSPGFGFSQLDAPRPLPEVRFADADGTAMSLSDFHGKIVLLNIWATWCVPCREEMPALGRLQSELGRSDFEVVALSIDRQGLPAVQAFYQDLNPRALRIYLDPSGKSARDLNVVGLPTTLLIDRDGNEIGRLVGPAEWDSPETVALIRNTLEAAPETDASTRSQLNSPQR